MDSIIPSAALLETIAAQSNLKQRVYDQTFATLGDLKETLFELASEMDDRLEGRLDRRVRLEYRDRGKYEAQLQVGADLLIAQMHTDVFCFDPAHEIWRHVDAPDAGYFGMVNIYNFLSDSLKNNRNADEGYLIARLFVNHARAFFVEGPGQTSAPVERFGEREIDRSALVEVLEAAIGHALRFDLYVPPYDASRRVTVDQFNSRLDNSKFVTGKRLGYELEE